MFRIPYNSHFSLRFVFIDIDDLPVDVSDADLSFNLSTRPTAHDYKAFVKGDSCLNAARLVDGSVLVTVKNNSLFPGKLKAVVNVYASEVDCRGDKKKHPELLSLSPEVPVEIIEPYFNSGHHNNRFAHFNPDVPVTVFCKFNLRNPQLSKHVTKGELNKAVEEAFKNLEGNELASSDDIADILELFNVQ